MAFRFENLEIWELACIYCDKIYLTIKQFPRLELFGLVSDLNRAGISIPANIAEGSGSDSNQEFRRYLGIAIKSLFETVSHLHIAKNRKYINDNEFTNLYNSAELLVKKIRSFSKTLQ